jgi:hypothetical protein
MTQEASVCDNNTARNNGTRLQEYSVVVGFAALCCLSDLRCFL